MSEQMLRDNIVLREAALCAVNQEVDKGNDG